MVATLTSIPLETTEPTTNVFGEERTPISAFEHQLTVLFSELQRRFGEIAFELKCCGGSLNIFLSPEESTGLFKIVLEAVDNSLRHSQAVNIKAEIALIHQNVIQVLISDNGAGFDLEKVAALKPYSGIKRICNYTQQIGARVIFDSAPGKGTQIAIAKAVSKERARFYTRLVALL